MRICIQVFSYTEIRHGLFIEITLNLYIQEYKRMSRDMETETDPRFLARSSSPASSASTDHCVEEYVAEVPFAGMFIIELYNIY